MPIVSRREEFERVSARRLVRELCRVMPKELCVRTFTTSCRFLFKSSFVSFPLTLAIYLSSSSYRCKLSFLILSSLHAILLHPLTSIFSLLSIYKTKAVPISTSKAPSMAPTAPSSFSWQTPGESSFQLPPTNPDGTRKSYKHQTCNYWARGDCRYSETECRYAHSWTDLGRGERYVPPGARSRCSVFTSGIDDRLSFIQLQSLMSCTKLPQPASDLVRLTLVQLRSLMLCLELPLTGQYLVRSAQGSRL